MQLSNFRKPARGHMPVKRVINLASVGEKPIRLSSAIPSVLLVIVLAGLLSKIAVTDRFAKVSEMRREVSAVQRQVDEVTEALGGFGDMTDRYAHYTFSSFSQDELIRTDRIAILDMVERMVMPIMVGSTWTVSGNQMVLNIQGATLEAINQLMQQLEAEPLVDYCTISTARQTPNSPNTDPVVASITIYFLPGDATVSYQRQTEEAEKSDSLLSVEGLNTLAERTAQIERQGVDEE